jgi:GWxTD domain-containing protein
MKKGFWIIIFSLVSFLSRAKEITANLTWCAFSTHEDKTYIETYLSIIGNSVYYVKKDNGKYQAAVDVVLMINNASNELAAGLKYTVNSEELSDTLTSKNFIDLQRIPLPPGLYTLSLIISDANRPGQERKIANAQSIHLDIDPDSASLSHTEFLDSYTPTVTSNVLSKSGIDAVPYVSSFFPENMQTLTFYSELYNMNSLFSAEEQFVVLYSIESVVSTTKINEYASFAKMYPQRVNSLLHAFDITALPSGNYNLVIEVRSADNRLLTSRKTPFERFNPGVNYTLNNISAVDISNTWVAGISSKDTLMEYIRCLRPISSESEKDFAEVQLKTGDLLVLQQYFLNFWLTRNEQNSQGAWLLYKTEVNKVNREFGTQIIKGYDSDRGRVYLQYGSPDQRTFMTNEPSAYPYEIWQYYTIRGNPALKMSGNQPSNTTQTNKRFVFANFDLVTNNYQLIHSDARGEIRDDRWQIRLTKRDITPRNVDETKGNSHYGNQSEDLFRNPR